MKILKNLKLNEYFKKFEFCENLKKKKLNFI